MTIHDKGLGFNDMDVEWTESKVKKTEQKLITHLKKIVDKTVNRTSSRAPLRARINRSSLANRVSRLV